MTDAKGLFPANIYDKVIAQMLARPAFLGPPPTDEERAALRLRAERRRADRQRFREAVAAVTDEQARSVLALHAEDRATDDWPGECAGCDFGGYDAEPPRWPCRTVELVAGWFDIEPPE